MFPVKFSFNKNFVGMILNIENNGEILQLIKIISVL